MTSLENEHVVPNSLHVLRYASQINELHRGRTQSETFSVRVHHITTIQWEISRAKINKLPSEVERLRCIRKFIKRLFVDNFR